MSTPSGTVQFSVDGANSGTPAGLSNGTAQFLISFATTGTHTISAAYSGDANHLSSKSDVLTVTVPYTSGSLPGSYSVTVTATGGSITHSSMVNLLVQ